MPVCHAFFRPGGISHFPLPVESIGSTNAFGTSEHNFKSGKEERVSITVPKGLKKNKRRN